MNQGLSGRLPFARKLGYGVGAVAYALPYQIVASFFLLYATAILRLPPLWAGIIMGISAVWDAITDPIMGYVSDNTTSHNFGRRHQYVLGGAVLIALFTYPLWSITPNAPPATKAVALCLLVLACKTALTVFIAPFNALGGELSTDYDERASIQGFRAFFHLIGMTMAMVGANLLFFRSTPEYPKGQLNPEAYPVMGLSFAVLALAFAVISFAATWRLIPMLPQRTEVMTAKRASFWTLLGDLRALLGNRDFVAVAGTIFVVEVGFQAGIAVGYHVSTYTYGLTAPIIAMLGLTVLGFSVLTQPFWLWMVKRVGKKESLIVAAVVALMGFVGMPWTHVWWGLFPLSGPTLPFTLAVFYALAGIGNGAFQSIPYSMVADAVDLDELATGKRDEGLYFGVYTFAYKLGSSVSVVLGGLMLHIIGFDGAAAVQSSSVQFNLAMVPSYLLVAITPLAFFLIHRYRIDRERQRDVRAQLDG